MQQALVASTGPFWDTVVICTLTGITLTTCLYAEPAIAAADGSLLSFHAFNTIGLLGSGMLTVSLAAFVVSTLLGWSYFGESALEYLGGVKLIRPYRAVWVAAVFVGAVIPKSSIVWNFSDCVNALMALPNLISLIALTPAGIPDPPLPVEQPPGRHRPGNCRGHYRARRQVMRERTPFSLTRASAHDFSLIQRKILVDYQGYELAEARIRHNDNDGSLSNRATDRALRAES